MRLNSCVLAALVAIASSGHDVWADQTADYQACLDQATAKMKQQILDSCWKLAENKLGTVADNSAETQTSISCEAESANFQLPGLAADACFQASFPPNPDERAGNPPRPPRAPAPSKNVPTPPIRSKNQIATTKAATPAPKPSSQKLSDTTDVAQANADADVAACTNIQSQATTCCNNPLSCASGADQANYAQLKQQATNGPQPGQSLGDYCAQASQLGANSGNLNINLAGVCASNQNSCQSTCSQMAGRYQALISSCGDCDNLSIYQSALASLNGQVSVCSGLRANATQLGSQGINSAPIQAGGSVCNQNVQAQAQSAAFQPAMNAPATGDLYGCSSNPTSQACVACTVNPNLPPCLAMAQAQQRASGKVGFSDAAKSKEEGSGFDPASLTDALAAVNAKMDMSTDSSGAKVSAATVPNNSGGAIPGSANSQSPASLSGGAHRAVPAAAENSTTDIMHGNFGGGYSPTYADAKDERFRDSSYRRPIGSSSDLRVDLKKYLPGGSLDPNRSVAGMGPMNVEINGKGVDLFLKISNKMEEKCKLGILWECKP